MILVLIIFPAVVEIGDGDVVCLDVIPVGVICVVNGCVFDGGISDVAIPVNRKVIRLSYFQLHRPLCGVCPDCNAHLMHDVYKKDNT